MTQWNLFKKWMFYKTLPLVLIAQIMVGQTLLLAGQDEDNKDPSQIPTSVKTEADLIEYAARKGANDPEAVAFEKKMNELNGQLESGKPLNLTVEERDPFHLRGQRLEVIQKDNSVRTYDLTELNVELPTVVYTALKPIVDQEKGELVFEAYNAGKLVARHVIADSNYVGFAFDKELLFLMDGKGNLSAMDMGYISREVFRGILPVFQKLWEGKLSGQHYRNAPRNELNPVEEVKMSFITIGHKPYSAQTLERFKEQGFVFRKDASGNDLTEAGDLYVEAKIGGQWKPYGVFSREVTQGFVYDNSTTFLKLVWFVSPESIKEKYALRIMEEVEKSQRAQAFFEDSVQGLGASVRNAFLSVQPEQVASMLKRTVGLDKTLMADAHRAEIPAARSASRDDMTIKQWVEGYSTIQTNAFEQRRHLLENFWDKAGSDEKAAYPELERLMSLDSADSQERLALEGTVSEALVIKGGLDKETADKMGALNQQIGSGDFSGSWKDLISWSKPKKLTKFQKTMLPVRDALTSEGVKYAARLTVLTGIALGAWVGYGFNDYAHQQDVQTITHFFSWFYDHYYPSVLKDAAYRTALFKSQAALLTAAIPGLMLGTWVAVGPGLKISARLFGSLSTKLNNFVEKRQSYGTDSATLNLARKLSTRAATLSSSFQEKAKIWGERSLWTNLITAGNRVYAKMIYPAWNWVFKSLLRNPTFLEALRNWVNPFTKVSANSSVGRKAGLKSDVRVGARNPLKPGMQQEVESQNRVLSLLMLQKKRATGLAWLLATLEVSGRENIDPATLLMMAQGMVKSDQLTDILKNPKKRELWQRMSQGIYDALIRLDQKGLLEQDLKEVEASEFAELYRQVQTVAEQVKNRSRFGATLDTLRARFARLSKVSVRNLIGLAREDSAKLGSYVAGPFVTPQVTQEYVSDSIIVGLYMGYFGERADLSKPEYLAADPTAQWDTTSAAMKNEMATNANLHLLSSGSNMVLVYQGTPSVREDRYVTRESLERPFAEVQEGVAAGMANWFINLGMLPQFLTNAFNTKLTPTPGMYESLKSSDIGTFAIRSYVKRLVVIQAMLGLVVLPRVLLGVNASFDDALGAFWLGMNASFFIYGWPWTVLRQGNLMENKRFGQAIGPLEDARTMIVRGLDGRGTKVAVETDEFGQETYIDQTEQGYNDLLSKYRRGYLGKEWLINVKKFKNAIRRAEALLEVPADQRFTKNQMQQMFGKEAADFYGKAAGLYLALEEKDDAKRKETVAREMKDLAMIVQSAMPNGTVQEVLAREQITKLNAVSLLDYAIKYPPVPTKPNPWVSEATTYYGGAILTTALATKLSVWQQDPNLLSASSLAFWTFMNWTGLTAVYLALGKEPLEAYGKAYNKYIAPTEQRVRKAVGDFRQNCKDVLTKKEP